MEQQDGGVALVLEGGGYRGVFTAGVLDVFMEKGIWDFSSVWGTSAGGLNATNFRSRQMGRNIRIMLAFRDDRRLMSFYSLATTGDITSKDFLYGAVQEELDPCDNETFNHSDMRMFVCASDVATGMPHYFEVKSLPDDIEKIRASSSLPLISSEVEIGGGRYLDGGTADSVPFAPAMGFVTPEEVHDYTPASKAVIVLTQHREYVKGEKLERMALLSRRYAEYPLFTETLRTRANRYMAQRERIWKLEEEGKALVLLPPKKVTVATNEHNGGPLLDLYLQGRCAATQNLDRVREFLTER